MCGWATYKLALQRFETTGAETDLSYLQQFLFFDFYDKFSFNKESLRVRLLINIYLLELLGTYRGWRHSRGLPVRGQRT